MSEYINFLDAYTGRDDTKSYIDARLKSANEKILSAEQNITALVTAGVGLLQDAQAFKPETEIPDWDVGLPDIDKNVLKNETKPQDPGLSGALPTTVDIDPLRVEDWDIGNVGDMPPDPPITLTPMNPLDPPTPMEGVTVPTEVMSFTPTAYTSGLFDFLAAQIQTFISALNDTPPVTVQSNIDLHGNTGDIVLVDVTLEEAIYDKARSRMLQEEQSAVQQAETTIQTRGFSLPPGALNAMISDTRRISANAQEDLNNDIITSRIGLEQKRTEYELQKAEQVTAAQFQYDSILVEFEKVNSDLIETIAKSTAVYFDAGAKLETLQTEVHKQEQQLLFEVDKETVESAYKVYNSLVESAKTTMEIFQVEASTLIAEMEADVSYNKALLDVFLGQIDAVKAKVEVERIKVDGKKVNADISNMEVRSEIESAQAENARLSALAGVYASEVQAYAARIDALKVAETLDLTRYDIEAKGKGVEISSLVQKASSEVELIVQRIALQLDTLKSQASISASIISASLNAMNTTASYGFTGGARSSSASTNSKRCTVNYGYHYSGATEDAGTPAALGDCTN